MNYFAILLGLLGGLALFLYGMQMMSQGLEAAAGNRMKKILEKLTSNRFFGVLVGAGITAVIQSSSATTVMVVGFVNSGIMTLRQAVWIIMGANIGTTITGQLIALDIDLIAPIIAFLGVAAIVFFKKPAFHHYGHILAGLGILFIGMGMMSSAMDPLSESAAFVSFMTRFDNPLLGILAGMIFTAVIQSSSASIGILQAMAGSGLIGLGGAVYILFGQNIGTCITAVLASIGTGRSAKRATVIHLLFNLIGTAIFTVLALTTPVVSWVEMITPGNNAVADIANMHTIFNVTTSLLLIPFGVQLAKLATLILPERAEEEIEIHRLMHIKPTGTLDENRIGNSVIVIHDIQKELNRMCVMVRENLDLSFAAVKEGRSASLEQVEKTEEYVDYLNKEISKYISKIITYETNERDSRHISGFFKIAGNLERIGDHAINICEYTKLMEKKNILFSERAQGEIEQMRAICVEAADVLHALDSLTPGELDVLKGFEDRIDEMTRQFRQNQIERMHSGACSDEACILYSEMLTDFERIGDHLLNIGEALVQA